MENKIKAAITEIQRYWKNPTMDSVLGIQAAVSSLANDQEVQTQLKNQVDENPSGLELHRDVENGFILLAYTENQGLYRIPHDHGAAWVIYAVISGTMEMGSYFKFTLPNDEYSLILKKREELSTGNTSTYFPGEIHDTLCLSKKAVILRLTSLDLKSEERLGRMHRYQKMGDKL